MKKLLIWAVLCIACTDFAMDHLSTEKYPQSPGKGMSEEDLKSLMEATPLHNPQEPRSASSSPIPIDPSQEDVQLSIAAKTSVQRVARVLQEEFKEWINSENILAFRGFLKEHFNGAEEYISDEIIELARQKKESTGSDVACEIHNLLTHLKFGKDNHLGDMEKIWHHTFADEIKESRQSNSNFCEAEILVIDHRDCGPLSHDHSASTSIPLLNFYQQKSIFNIALRDLIEYQKLDDIIDLVCVLTEDNDCDLSEVISDKTVEVAYQKMISERTATSETIYGIINGETNDIPVTGPDTTAESLDRIFCDDIDRTVLSVAAQKTMIRSMVLTCIENNDIGGIYGFRQVYDSDTQAAEYITPDLLETAHIMRDRVAVLQDLLDSRRVNDAYKVWEKLDQIVNNPCPVVLLTSGSDSDYSEDGSDTKIVLDRIKNAFTQSTLESIVDTQKAEKIMQLLAKEKENQKKGELDWVSPLSSPPSDQSSLAEYLGFKALKVGNLLDA